MAQFRIYSVAILISLVSLLAGCNRSQPATGPANNAGAVATAPHPAREAFEKGLIIHEKTTIPSGQLMAGQERTSTKYFSGSAFRDVGSDGSDLIVLLDEQKMIQLDHRRKEYREILFAELEKKIGNLPETLQAPKVQRTGRTETIAGYATEQHVIDMGAFQIEMWAAPDLKVPAKFSEWQATMLSTSLLARQYAKMMEPLRQIKGYPLRTVVKIGLGSDQLTMTTEATQVEQSAVDPSRFQVPSDYKKLTH
jgi:hypothetical protein